jgi:hypothetical protein
MRSNAVVGVLYKGVEPYLEDYFSSIMWQTTKQFCLYFFDNHSEGVCHLEQYFQKCRDRGIKVHIIPLPKKNCPLIIVRKFMIDFLKKEKLQKIVFTDTDDYFSQKRFEKSFQALEESGVVFNDLIPFNSKTKEEFPSMFSQQPFREVCFKDLLDKNLLGYSHLAIQAKQLENIFPLKLKNVPQVTDWRFFGSILSSGVKATFLPNAPTFYRQYQENTIGLKRSFTSGIIKKGLDVKISVYEYFLEHITIEGLKLSIQEKLKETIELKNHLKSENKMEKYLEKINLIAKKRVFFWWEFINPEYKS